MSAPSPTFQKLFWIVNDPVPWSLIDKRAIQMDDENLSSDLPESWSPPRPEDVADPCGNHPELSATMRCRVCSSAWCEACLSMRKVGAARIAFCPACGGMCESVYSKVQAKPAALPEETSFFAGLGAAFGYPFRGEGLYILLGGTLLLSVAALVPFGFIIGLIAGGYLAAYLMSVLSTSAQGDQALPGWPEFSDPWDDIVRPWLLMFGTVAFCLAPWWLAGRFMADSEHVRWIEGLLLVAGLFYLPMALSAVAVFDNFAALNPLLVVPSILKVPGEYFVVCVLVALTVGVADQLELLLGAWLPRFLAVVPAQFGSLYLTFVAMRALGILYHRNRDQLHWF